MLYDHQEILNYIQNNKPQKHIIVVVINSAAIHAEVMKTLAFLQKAGVAVERRRLQRIEVGEYKLLFTTAEYYGKLRDSFTDYVTFFQEGVNQNVSTG